MGRGRLCIEISIMGYWEDYSFFISKVEELTGLSPSDILERYKILIEELEENDVLEWLYEDYDEFTILKINKILVEPSLRFNALKQEFESNISILDKRIFPYLNPSIDITKNWKADFKIGHIEFEKH